MIIQKGDYGINLAWTLYQADGISPFDLTNYTVTIEIWPSDNVQFPIVHNGACSVIIAANGTVTFTVPIHTFDIPGNYAAAFKISKTGELVSFEPFNIVVT